MATEGSHNLLPRNCMLLCLLDSVGDLVARGYLAVLSVRCGLQRKEHQSQDTVSSSLMSARSHDAPAAHMYEASRTDYTHEGAGQD